jgi:glycosyltransferase involved in cell wall biosynthesis
MQIHYYMQYFPGAESPGSRQPFTFSKFLAQRGHQVTVVAADSNLDTGLREEPVDLMVEGGGRLRILRLLSLSGGRGSNAARLKAYLSFMLAAAGRGMLLPRPDVILGSIQPLFTGLAALGVARLRGVPFVLEVRDLWPDALEVKGAMTGWKAVPLHWIANRLYRDADRIVTLTPGIRMELLKKGVSRRKIDVFPNGFDSDLFQTSEGTRAAVRERYGWGNDFVAIYTGSFTEVTAVEVMVRAAAQLLHRQNIRFELFGNGPTKAQVMSLAQSLKLENVHFHDSVPKRETPGLLAAADVALMCLFKSPLIHIYFENKFMDYMGAGKPILAAMEGEQARLIRTYGTGRVVSTFDHEGLARLVEDAALSYGPYANMGENGRKLVYGKLLLPKILDRYIGTLEAVGQNKSFPLSAWSPFQGDSIADITALHDF